MGQGIRLEIRQSQQLAMTPQLQQAIRLLQLSNLELQQWLIAEQERNPLLHLDDGTGTAEAERGASDDDGPDLADEALDNLHGGGTAAGVAAPPHDAEATLAARPTLRAHLLAQLGQARSAPPVLMLATAIVEALDEHGMLREPPDEIAARLGLDAAAGEAALRLVQRCDPTGVGARTLGECLALQLAERGRLDPAMQALLDNLPLLAEGRHQRLAKLTGMDAEDLADAVAEIRTLDPRPCAAFAAPPADPVIPDVIVRRTAWGGRRVELNADSLPRVLVDRAVARRMADHGPGARKFVAEARADANWLIRSLESRARTILKVAQEIVRVQDRFFDEGASGLQPLTLRMVADATGIHESTASRVTANKFIATERGVFELKHFFTNAVGADGAEAHAASSIRHRIRAMIDAEPADGILSDDTICARLSDEGIEIARRTVAKYRKLMKIPSSTDRRRQKALHALR